MPFKDSEQLEDWRQVMKLEYMYNDCHWIGMKLQW